MCWGRGCAVGTETRESSCWALGDSPGRQRVFAEKPARARADLSVPGMCVWGVSRQLPGDGDSDLEDKLSLSG